MAHGLETFSGRNLGDERADKPLRSFEMTVSRRPSESLPMAELHGAQVFYSVARDDRQSLGITKLQERRFPEKARSRHLFHHFCGFTQNHRNLQYGVRAWSNGVMECGSDGFETQYSNIPLLQHSICCLVAFFSLIVGMTAHGIPEPFSHRATIGAVWIALYPFSIRLHLCDDEMRTGSFESVLHPGRKCFFRTDSAGVRDPRALRDFFQISPARGKRRSHARVGAVIEDDGDKIQRVDIGYSEQAAGIDHQTAVGIQRDNLAVGKGGGESEREGDAQPHVTTKKIRSLEAERRPKRRVRRKAGDR